MTQSVDVNALFDWLALLVTRGVSDPDSGTIFNEIDIAALNTRVGVDATAISMSTDLFARIMELERLNRGPNTYIDGTSFVITDATKSFVGATWDKADSYGNHPFWAYEMFDDDPRTFARFWLEKYSDNNPTGNAFVDFDAGSLIDISGFWMKIYDGVNKLYPDWVPRTNRLRARLSTSDPWITIGTSIVDTPPPTRPSDPIQVLFPSVSYRYFRFEMDGVVGKNSGVYKVTLMKPIAS